MKIKKAGAGDFWFSGRALAWHVQGPELGPQHQEKKKKKTKEESSFTAPMKSKLRRNLARTERSRKTKTLMKETGKDTHNKWRHRCLSLEE
jgi:hypothetical protein